MPPITQFRGESEFRESLSVVCNNENARLVFFTLDYLIWHNKKIVFFQFLCIFSIFSILKTINDLEKEQLYNNINYQDDK